MKRTTRGSKSKKKNKIIKCNRPGWRKKVLGRKGYVKYKHRGLKIKGKEWEKVE